MTSQSVSSLLGVRLDRNGPVATMMLCRPEVRNALTPDVLGELRRLGDDLPGDVRVVVVRGAGDSFSSGLDLSQAPSVRAAPRHGKALSSDNLQRGLGAAVGGNFGPDFIAGLVCLPPSECAARIAEFQQAFAWLRRPDLISVAAVRGQAIGAGFQLALACDLRVLAHDARLAMPEVTQAMVPYLGGTKRLVDLVGYARAVEICVTGRQLDAAEAYRIGLANVLVPGTGLDAAVDELVTAILAAPRDAVIEAKALLAGAATTSYEEQLRAERAAQARCLADLAGLGE